jgi:hypothetical protein
MTEPRRPGRCSRGMRTAIVALITFGTLLGLAPAAYAKGPTAATIEGPGLAEPVRIESYETTSKRPGLDSLIGWTGATIMYDGMMQLAPDRPAVELGPRYTITYYLDRQPVLTQEMYPFAEDSPYTFTPAGQKSIFIGTELQTGWFRSPQSLETALLALGADPLRPSAAEQPQPAAAGAAPVDTTAPDGGFPPRWWPGAALVGALLVAGLAGAVLLPRLLSRPLVHRGVGARR